MAVLLSTRVFRAIAADAGDARGREVCGLLFGAPDRVAAHSPARNLASDPRRAFEIDPAALLRAHREQRRGGPAIVGCYHSHPTGPPEPSTRDAADAEPNGWLWLIVAAGGAKMWRATRAGSVHGRFDPVPFACVDGAHPPESALSA